MSHRRTPLTRSPRARARARAGRVGRAALLSLLALAPATSAAAGAGHVRTHRATCDEVPGQNAAANDRWRIFYENEGDPAIDPQLLACRRTTAPVRRMLWLSSLYARADLLTGDLVEFANSGKYGNSERYVLDLAALRSVTIATDFGNPAGQLLENGAIVFTPLAEQAKATSVVPFGGGVYFTASDGTLRRFAASEPASSVAWARDRDARWRRFSLRVPTRAGLRTTFLGSVELRERAARGGRAATLALHRPTVESLSFDHDSDLVARLVPGSQAELRLAGHLVIGRFADHPNELRLRLPSWWKPGRFLVDLPAPAAIDTASVVEDGRGDLAYLDGGDMVILDLPTGGSEYAVTRVPLPAGATDFALAPPDGSVPGMRSQLYFTTPDGLPNAVPYGAAMPPLK